MHDMSLALLLCDLLIVASLLDVYVAAKWAERVQYKLFLFYCRPRGTNDQKDVRSNPSTIVVCLNTMTRNPDVLSSAVNIHTTDITLCNIKAGSDITPKLTSDATFSVKINCCVRWHVPRHVSAFYLRVEWRLHSRSGGGVGVCAWVVRLIGIVPHEDSVVLVLLFWESARPLSLVRPSVSLSVSLSLSSLFYFTIQTHWAHS